MWSRQETGRWVESVPVQRGIVVLIVINAVTLGLETSASLVARYGDLLHGFDNLVLGVFVVEILLKLYARGLGFFRRAWNVFDFVFIGIIVDTMQTLHEDQASADRGLIEQTVDRDTGKIEQEVRALREEIGALRQLLEQGR